MDEHRQEQAAAYALGALPESERAEFEQALARDPKLQALVRELSDALGEAARSLPTAPPPPALKARIMAKVAAAKPAPQPDHTRVVQFPAWIPWAAAAGLAISSLWLWSERAKLADAVASNSRARSQLERTIAEMRTEADSLRTRAAEYAADADNLKLEASALERSIRGLEADLTVALKNADLANMQVARLASLVADRPQAMGVSLWNDSTQQGVLLVENLPVPAPDKTYEFWVIDPALGAPVSAGIFATDAEGRGRIVFRPRSGVQRVATFAVSVEQAGGSPGAGPQGPVIMAGDTTQL